MITAADGTVTQDGTEATISGLAQGFSYEVQVRARNEDMTGYFSPTLLSGAITGRPDAPADPGVEMRLDPTRVRLSWSPPPRDGGADITAYRHEYREAGTSDWTRPTPGVSADRNYVEVEGLTVGANYEFRVAAHNSFYLSDFSRPVTIKVVERPGVPTGIAATLAQEIGNRVTVSWVAPESDGGQALVGYDYQYRRHAAGQDIDAGWEAVERVHDPDVTEAVVGDLDFRTDYEFRVRARNEAHDGRFGYAAPPPAPTVRTTLPTVTLVLEPAQIVEGAFSRVTARLSAESQNETTITVSAAGDGATLSEDRTLTIRDGELQSIGAVTVSAADDDVDAPDRTVTVSGTVMMTRLSELARDPPGGVRPAAGHADHRRRRRGGDRGGACGRGHHRARRGPRTRLRRDADLDAGRQRAGRRGQRRRRRGAGLGGPAGRPARAPPSPSPPRTGTRRGP